MGARLEQTTGWGRAPLQGTCRRVAILQGTGGEAAGGKGGHPTAGWQAVRWFTSPFRAVGLVPTPSPPVPVCKEEQVAKGGERGRGARPLGTQLPHVARRRRGHPQPQPAPLTWFHSRWGQGRLAGLGASPAPLSETRARTCARGWQGRGCTGYPPPPRWAKRVCEMPGPASHTIRPQGGGWGELVGTQSALAPSRPGPQVHSHPTARLYRAGTQPLEDAVCGDNAGGQSGRGHGGLDPLTQAGPG